MAIFARGVITCRFRILDSSVPMVQPAKDQMRNNVSGPLDWARVGRVLPERNVSSHVIIIGGIFRKNSSKVLCVEHNQMISALASDRPARSSVQHCVGRRWNRPRAILDCVLAMAETEPPHISIH